MTYGCWYKQRLLDLGLFDESLVRNQDDELNLRTVLRGGRIWQTPRIRSWYSPRSSVTKLFRQYYQYGYWKVRVINKHRRVASFRHLVPAAALSGALVMLVAGYWWRPALIALGAFAVTYFGLSIVAALRAGLRSRDWILIPSLPLVFATYHFSYSLGFLRALTDSIWGRRARSSVTQLSR
ncbi:MAG TPA: hypothetical protein PK159_14045 [Steroidobacteraceae bacterium]|nr:hypothetical protein [Steroidobacteraceae bacterium]